MIVALIDAGFKNSDWLEIFVQPIRMYTNLRWLFFIQFDLDTTM